MEKINSFEEFKEAVKDFITAKLPDCDVELVDVPKNNSVCLSGIVVRQKNKSIAPTIYLESCYAGLQSGESFTDVTSEIMHRLKDGMKEAEDVNINIITDFALAKDKICYSLINKSANRELLKTVPNRNFHDLAIIYYIMFDPTDRDVSLVKIYNDMAQHWGVNEEQLYTLACKNTPILNRAQVMPMEDVIGELTDIIGISSSKDREHITDEGYDISFTKSQGPSFYIATNTNKLNGAGVILYDGLLQTVSQKIGSLFVLPSSVHECILVPGELSDAEPMVQMVREANQTAVSGEEILGNNIYYYDTSNNDLQMIS